MADMMPSRRRSGSAASSPPWARGLPTRRRDGWGSMWSAFWRSPKMGRASGFGHNRSSLQGFSPATGSLGEGRRADARLLDDGYLLLRTEDGERTPRRNRRGYGSDGEHAGKPSLVTSAATQSRIRTTPRSSPIPPKRLSVPHGTPIQNSCPLVSISG
jgi:hypothetical protein